MTRPSKLIVWVAGSFIGLVALLGAAAALFLHANTGPRLEAVASQALEMEVTVDGRLAVGFLPGLHVTLTDVRAGKGGAEIASAEEVDVGIEILPLIHGEVRITTVGLKRLKLSIARDRDGQLNVGRSPRTEGIRPGRAVAEITVSDATLHYVNQQSGVDLEAVDCDLAVIGLQLAAGGGGDVSKDLSFTASLACGELTTREVTASDLRISVDGRNGVFVLEPVTMQLLGGQGSGELRADLSGAVPAYQFRYELTKFSIEDLLKVMSPGAGERKTGEGRLDFSATLSLQGKTVDELKRSAAGEAAVYGQDLTLEIGNLDEKLSRYESSQNFDLVDVGAVFLAGPLGLGLTKGYDFARIFEDSGGSTRIRTLVSTWQVEHGVAHATDVAMATLENRLALKGRLDFVTGRFDDVTVALIDDNGCARARQRIRGPFDQPEVEKPDVLSTLAGPTLELLKRAGELLGSKCDVFYAGSVMR